MMTKAITLFFFSSAALAAVAGCDLDSGKATVTVQGPGRVRSNPAGIDCGAQGGRCDAELGSSFELSAQPIAGAHFERWEGDEACVLPGRAHVVIGRAPDHEIECTAIFADGEPVVPTP